MNKNEKDQHILEEFVHIYCGGQHKTSNGQLCANCQDLLSYSLQRLQRCPQDVFFLLFLSPLKAVHLRLPHSSIDIFVIVL